MNVSGAARRENLSDPRLGSLAREHDFVPLGVHAHRQMGRFVIFGLFVLERSVGRGAYGRSAFRADLRFFLLALFVHAADFGGGEFQVVAGLFHRCDHAVDFAAVAGHEVARRRAQIARVGGRPGPRLRSSAARRR